MMARDGMGNLKSHLTSEEMERALAGQPLAEVTDHLRDCPRCADELAAATVMFAELRESAMVTAERYQRLGLAKTTRGVRRVGGMAWGLVAAMLCVGVMAPVALRHRGAVEAPVVVDAGQAQGAPQMSDDALLSSVQDDLSSSVPEPLLPLAGSGGSTTTDNTGTQRTTR